MIELPLTDLELFKSVGIKPTNGVLLHGHPGGKLGKGRGGKWKR